MTVAEEPLPRRGPYPWGPMNVAIGAAAGFGAFLLTSIILAVVLVAMGGDFQLEDVGGPFEKAEEVTRYAGERLDAARRGVELPDPPELFADVTAIKAGFAVTFFYQVALVIVVVVASRQKPGDLARIFKLETYRFWDLWLPAVVTIGCYVGVIAYSLIAIQIGIDFFIPESTVPDAVTRDGVALLLAGVLACGTAPFTEELFFRGFIFSGLLRWGFLPAGAVSAFAFQGAHLDSGSIIPFFLIGLAFAWLYWRRGRLWDSIAAHFMFNATSFILLAATA